MFAYEKMANLGNVVPRLLGVSLMLQVLQSQTLIDKFKPVMVYNKVQT